MADQRYRVHGIGIRVITESASLNAVVSGLLSAYPDEGPSPLSGIDLHLIEVPEEELPPIPTPSSPLSSDNATHVIGTFRDWSLHADGRRLIVDFPRHGRLFLNGADRAECYLLPRGPDDVDVRGILIHFTLVETLKKHGLFGLHAAAVAKHGAGILIPGLSGSGKTTCCLALIRAGYRCLSDDNPFLRSSDSGIEVLSFWEELFVTPKTLEFFPELSPLRDPSAAEAVKRRVSTDSLYPDSRLDACVLRIVLFPTITDSPTSRLEPMSASDSLVALMPHALRILDRDVARRTFDLLAQVARETQAYRVHAGQDIISLSRLIDPLVAPPSSGT